MKRTSKKEQIQPGKSAVKKAKPSKPLAKRGQTKKAVGTSKPPKVKPPAPTSPKTALQPTPPPQTKSVAIATSEASAKTPVGKAPAEPAAASPMKKPKRRLPTARTGTEKELKVPPILLEGDAPTGTALSGPGLRYALAPQPVAPARRAEIGELPEAYGTGRVFLAARDPHWLYASWDFTNEQQKELNARSRDGHLILRIFAERENVPTVPELHVHPESRNWFINVPRAETRYWAEIGFYEKDGEWRSVSVSQSTFAPPEAPSEDVSAEFATIPPEVTFKQVVEAVEQFVSRKEGQPLLEAVAEAQKQEQRVEQPVRPREEAPREQPAPHPESSQPRRGEAQAPTSRGRSKEHSAIPVRIEAASPWNRGQRAALKRLISIDERRRVFLGSIEITELVRRQLEEEIASIAAQEARGVPVELRMEQAPGIGTSSPLGGEMPKGRRRKFWFKINAELIIYGATEPDAKVTVAERPIKLRPDGSFSFRFSLPDGRYQLPAVAVSGDGEEAKEARLEFARSTAYRGEVEAHAQDAALRPPRAEHIQ
jgi:uncharacterized protein